MHRASTQRLLLQKQLGDRLAWTIKQHRARFVLIASARVGDGKSTFLCMIRPYLECRYPEGYFFLSLEDLLSLDPYEIPEGIVVLIDGPAIMEGVESLFMPPDWQDVIKDAVLVVRGRNTTADELQESCSRLESMEIRCIGAIYNELQDPAGGSRTERAGSRLERLLPWGRKAALEESVPIVLPDPDGALEVCETAERPEPRVALGAESLGRGVASHAPDQESELDLEIEVCLEPGFAHAACALSSPAASTALVPLHLFSHWAHALSWAGPIETPAEPVPAIASGQPAPTRISRKKKRWAPTRRSQARRKRRR